jgi:hypothetical protein
MQNKTIRLGPIAVPATVTNLFNPPTVTGGTNPPATSTATYYILKHIRIINKSTTAAVTFSGFIGATGGSTAGTEFLGSAISIASNSAYDWYGVLRLDTADFFTGSASVVTTLVIQAEGEMGIAG